MTTPLSQERLKHLLSYDPGTGKFTWVNPTAHWIKPGEPAGYSRAGYCQIRLDKKLYYAHRLAFLYMTGAFPVEQVDHINGVKTDDRWDNLRQVGVQDNQRNAAISKNNTSGTSGVVWDKRKQKWMARIHIDYKTKFLGYFDDIADAAKARKEAEKLYNFHPNHGRS